MNRTMKPLLALTLVLAIIFSLAGCSATPTTQMAATETSSTATETSSAATETSSAATDATEAPSTGPLSLDEILKPYDETVVLRSVKVTNSAQNFIEGSPEDNIWLDDLLAEMNIKVEYDWVVDVTQSEAKMSSMIASGSMQDFFNPQNLALATSVMEEGLTYDITDIYQQYASPSLKMQDEAFPDGFRSGFVNGRMKGIAELGFGLANEPELIWIREDWLKESGKEIPKTMDELVTLAEIFMKQHPGTYGIAVDKSITSPWQNSLVPFFNAYGAYSKIWMKNGGQIEYSSIQPEMKNALQFAQDLYNKGIIDKEFSVKDINKVNEDISASKVGIVGGATWLSFDSIGNTVKADINATWIPIPVPSATGNTVKLQANWPGNGFWLINKDCEHPEAVIKMLSWYMENNNDGRWSDPKYENQGGLFGGSPIFQTTPADEKAATLACIEAFKKRDPAGLTPKARNYYDMSVMWHDEKNPDGFGRSLQTGPGGALEIMYGYEDRGDILLTYLRGAIPSEYSLAKPTLDKLEDDVFTRIVMGESIDSFDEYVSNWKLLGGDDATAQVNSIYNK